MAKDFFDMTPAEQRAAFMKKAYPDKDPNAPLSSVERGKLNLERKRLLREAKKSGDKVKPNADKSRRGRLRFPNLEERKENYDRRTKVINRNKAKRATDKGGRERADGSKGFKPQSLADQKIGPPKTTTKKATTNKAPIVSKKQLKDSGFTNLRDYMNNKQGKTRRDNKAPVKVKDNKSNFKPTKTNIGPNMSTVNKRKATPKKSLIDRAKDTAGINRPATAKEQRGRDLQRNARKSMGMKKGGMVKKCRMDGIALRGKTRAKERSK